MKIPFLVTAMLLACGSAQAGATFVANHGQYPSAVRFAAPGHPLMPWATDSALWLTLPGDNGAVALRLSLSNALPGTQVAGNGPDSGAIFIYRGAQPQRRATRVRSFYSLVFSSPGSGATITVSTSGGDLTLNYQHASDTARAAISIEGADIVADDGAGGPLLLVNGKAQALPLRAVGKPLSLSGTDRNGAVTLATLPAAPASTNSAVLGADGSIAYATFLGSGLADEAEAVHHHGGDLYLAGHTQGFTFPATPGSVAPARQHVVNAFVARVSPGSPETNYVTLFQGSDQLDGEEFAFALKVNDAGEAFFAGNTNSEDFPVTAGAHNTRYGGAVDAFVGKLNADGSLAYASYFGGSEFDSVYGLAVDASNNAYVVGGSWSTDLPTTANAFAGQSQGERDAFIAVFDAAGASLSYCSYLGGSSQDQAEAVAIDADHRIHLTGWTRSADLGPSVAPPQAPASSPFDAFAARIDPSGATADYAVTLGGSGEDRGDAIAVDTAGRAVLSGLSAADDFPVTPSALDASYGGGTCSFAPCPDAFLAVLAGDGQTLDYASYYGGSLWDAGRALVVDAIGVVTLVGITESPDLAVAGALADDSLGGFSDAFVASFDLGAGQAVLSTYLGGTAEDGANAVAVADDGSIYVSGQTRSSDFPVTPDAFAGTLSGDYDAFVAVLSGGNGADTDGDGIQDSADNCTLVFNPQQTDSNGDGFGNRCDGDLNNDCAVNFTDLGAMKAVFFSASADADLTGDGSVNFADLAALKAGFFQPPGPSATADCANR